MNENRRVYLEKLKKSEEKPAKGITGCILYDPRNDQRWFRVEGKDATGAYTYKDYKLHAEDIKIILDSDVLSLYESEEGNFLDWSKKYLHLENESNGTEPQS